MMRRSHDTPERLKRFLDEVDDIGVRAEYLGSLNLKWDPPNGKPVNLGYIKPDGQIWTDASYWRVDESFAQDYNERLAALFGGKVRTGKPKKDGRSERWVARLDGTPFRIENVTGRLSGWCGIIEEFQRAIRERARNDEV